MGSSTDSESVSILESWGAEEWEKAFEEAMIRQSSILNPIITSMKITKKGEVKIEFATDIMFPWYMFEDVA